MISADLSPDRVTFTTAIPVGQFDVAVFAETTSHRLQNFRTFLEQGTARRILLEKPMSAVPCEVREFHAVALAHGVDGITQVNFGRRHWPHLHKLAEYCGEEARFSVTLNGGAIGLGCMGIHYLDTFLALSRDEVPEVAWAELSKTMVASGRGTQFADFGGDFVLTGPRGPSDGQP